MRFDRIQVVGGLILLGMAAGCDSGAKDGQDRAATPPVAPVAPEPQVAEAPAANAPAAAPTLKRASSDEPVFETDGPVQRSRYGRLSRPMGAVHEGAARTFLAENAA